MSFSSERQKLIKKLEKNLEKNLIILYRKSIKNIKSVLSALEEKGYLNQTEIYRYNRLVSMHNNIGNISNELIKASNKLLDEYFIEEYRLGSNFEQYIIEATLGEKLNFSLLSINQIKSALVNTLDPSTYLLRNKSNILGITQKLNLILAQGIVQGLSYRELAKKIDEVFSLGFKNALKLAKTESHRIREKASFDKALEASNMGISIEKMWKANFDDKTRDPHAEADGQIVPIEEPFIVNGEEMMYPGDPAGSAENVVNCRCYRLSIVEGIMPEKIRIKGEGLSNYTTYEEWYKNK